MDTSFYPLIFSALKQIAVYPNAVDKGLRETL